jgi:hypothetical protein
MLTKEQKIEQILALMRGEISPDDINPECVMMIGYGTEDNTNLYQVNGKYVERDIYDEAVKRLAPDGFNITYGGQKL